MVIYQSTFLDLSLGIFCTISHKFKGIFLDIFSVLESVFGTLFQARDTICVEERPWTVKDTICV